MIAAGRMGACISWLLLMNFGTALPEAKPGACYGHASCCWSKAASAFLSKRLGVLRGGYGVINPEWAEKMGMDPDDAHRSRTDMVPEHSLYIGNLDEKVLGHVCKYVSHGCLPLTPPFPQLQHTYPSIVCPQVVHPL